MNINAKKNICAVIVTYGDRWKFVSQVINRLFGFSQVCKIILVDNGSMQKLSERELLKNNAEKVSVVHLDKNYGSAKGFGAGLRAARALDEIDYIWILDDDNVPHNNALEILLLELEKSMQCSNPSLICFASYRPARFWHSIAIEKSDPEYVVGRINSFMRFHIFDFTKRLKNKICYSLVSNEKNKNIEQRKGQIAVAPYGGLFFNKKILDTIGYPDERYFLYVDDNEFTYRMTSSGICIILILDSIVDDIDMSWDASKKNSFQKLLEDGSDYRVYYSIRNRIHFENKYRVSNKLLYLINMSIWFLILFPFAIFTLRIKRFCFIRKAIRDGFVMADTGVCVNCL